MHPYISIFNVTIGSFSFLTYVYVFISFFIFFFSFEKKWIPSHITLFLILFFSSSYGGKLFHILLEKPELLKKQTIMLEKADGLVFYGGFFAGLILYPILIRILYPKEKSKKLWDLAAILVAFGYGLLRIGCFLAGCCWGRICSLPWAVQYFNPNSVMPFLGVPVHPVQLYDSFLSFLIMGLLVYLYKKKSKVSLIGIFCILHPIARFITEFFRGDTYRGENVIWFFSTSQFISLFVLIFGVFLIKRSLKKV